MPQPLAGLLAVTGRILLCGIFLMSAIAFKIPMFSEVVKSMAKEGIPIPQVMLVGAIVFLIAGSVSIILGFKARVGALLLFVFLGLATYYFHDFWNMPDATAETIQNETGNFMKNCALMGAMLLIMANGSGPWSLDNALRKPAKT